MRRPGRVRPSILKQHLKAVATLQEGGVETGWTRRWVVSDSQHVVNLEVESRFRITARAERVSSNLFEREPYMTS